MWVRLWAIVTAAEETHTSAPNCPNLLTPGTNIGSTSPPALPVVAVASCVWSHFPGHHQHTHKYLCFTPMSHVPGHLLHLGGPPDS